MVHKKQQGLGNPPFRIGTQQKSSPLKAVSLVDTLIFLLLS